MILNQVKVFGFRSIQEWVSNFWLDKRLTILVGANEHGKSNLLEAVSFLNKDDYTSDDGCRSRNFRSEDRKYPEINFILTLNTNEKQLIIDHIQKLLDSIPEERDEDTKKLYNILSGTLGDLSSDDNPQIEVSVHSGYVKGFFYLRKAGGKRLINKLHPLNESTTNFMEGLLPKVISFGSGSDFPSRIKLDDLNNRVSKEWEGLLKLGVGVWEGKEKLFQGDLEGRDFREAARAKIQRRLRNIWSQGRQSEADLKIDFELDTSSGELLLDFIDRTGTRDQINHRSLGFKSFFSFYLRLYAETTEIDPHGYIFTFDEPGLHLHPSGQKDLLREIRKISEKNQIIFTTHSPFLIDRHPSTKVIVVSKDQEGTKLDQKPYRKNWAPLRSSLGLVMNDTFFYADRTLLVEGTSDRILIYSLLQKYADRLDIDINFLSVIDGDDRKELPSIARILLAEDRNLVMLVDKDKGGGLLMGEVGKIATSMRKGKLLKAEDYGDLILLDEDTSIEDILPKEPLEQAIQKYLKETLKCDAVFSLADVNKNGHTLGKALTDYFLEKGWTTETSKFSKTTVADFFSTIFFDYSDDIPEDHPSLLVSQKLKEQLDLK